jgi:hypothetical protein
VVDRKALKDRVAFNLLTHPITLWPVVGGVTAVAAGWAFAVPALIFGGIVGVLGGVGHFATRILTGAEGVEDDAFAELKEEADVTHQSQLDTLHEELSQDGEPRSEQLLSDLRTLTRRFREGQGLERIDPATRLELQEGVEALATGCVDALKRSLEIYETSREVLGRKARRALLDRREALLDEVEESITKLSMLLADAEGLSVEQAGTDRLDALRSQLDRSVDLVRRVKREMEEME